MFIEMCHGSASASSHCGGVITIWWGSRQSVVVQKNPYVAATLNRTSSIDLSIKVDTFYNCRKSESWGRVVCISPLDAFHLRNSSVTHNSENMTVCIKGPLKGSDFVSVLSSCYICWAQFEFSPSGASLWSCPAEAAATKAAICSLLCRECACPLSDAVVFSVNVKCIQRNNLDLLCSCVV